MKSVLMSVVLIASVVFGGSAPPAQAGLRLKQKDAQRVDLKYCGGSFSVVRQRDRKLHIEATGVSKCSLLDINQTKGLEVKNGQSNDILLNERDRYEIRFYSKSGKTWDDFVVENVPEAQAGPTFNFTCQCATSDGLYFPAPVTVEALNLNDAVDTMVDACANPLVKLGYRGDLRAASAACR